MNRVLTVTLAAACLYVLLSLHEARRENARLRLTIAPLRRERDELRARELERTRSAFLARLRADTAPPPVPQPDRIYTRLTLLEAAGFQVKR